MQILGGGGRAAGGGRAGGTKNRRRRPIEILGGGGGVGRGEAGGTAAGGRHKKLGREGSAPPMRQIFPILGCNGGLFFPGTDKRDLNYRIKYREL